MMDQAVVFHGSFRISLDPALVFTETDVKKFLDKA